MAWWPGKVASSIVPESRPTTDGGEIEVWGDGEQTRSFLYVDECVEAVRRLMDSPFSGPVEHRI